MNFNVTNEIALPNFLYSWVTKQGNPFVYYIRTKNEK